MKCQQCYNSIEDIDHFLFNYPKYTHRRLKWENQIKKIFPIIGNQIINTKDSILFLANIDNNKCYEVSRDFILENFIIRSQNQES